MYRHVYSLLGELNDHLITGSQQVDIFDDRYIETWLISVEDMLCYAMLC